MAVIRSGNGQGLKRVDDDGLEPPPWAKDPLMDRRSGRGGLILGGLVALMVAGAALWVMSPWRHGGAPAPAQARETRESVAKPPKPVQLRTRTPADGPRAASRRDQDLTAELNKEREETIITPTQTKWPTNDVRAEVLATDASGLPTPLVPSARPASVEWEVVESNTAHVTVPTATPPTLAWSPLGISQPASKTPSAAPAIAVHRLDFTVIDAEYSDSLDRVVIVTEQPNALHLYDPAQRRGQTLELPRTPTSVSISPDGRFAAVGHDAKLTGVDLNPLRIAKTFAVACDVGDTVLADNGYIYAAPARGGAQHLRAVLIAANTEFQHSGRTISAGMRIKLHPAGDRLYGMRRSGSPTDLERINIDSGIPVYGYDSPYHGDYPMGRDLWLSADGRRIFTAGGSVFHTAADRKRDMTYAGSLKPLTAVEHLTHAPAAGRVLAVPGTGVRYRAPRSDDDTPSDNQVFFFDDKNLNLLDTVTLPDAKIDGEPYPLHGRFVFVDAKGERFFVLAVVTPKGGGEQPWVIASGRLDRP